MLLLELLGLALILSAQQSVLLNDGVSLLGLVVVMLLHDVFETELRRHANNLFLLLLVHRDHFKVQGVHGLDLLFVVDVLVVKDLGQLGLKLVLDWGVSTASGLRVYNIWVLSSFLEHCQLLLDHLLQLLLFDLLLSLQVLLLGWCLNILDLEQPDLLLLLSAFLWCRFHLNYKNLNYYKHG